MDNKKLVKKYYRKLWYFTRYNFWYTSHFKFSLIRGREMKFSKSSIKGHLEKIINDGNDYLLTNAYLFNIETFHSDDYHFNEGICDHLSYISGNNHEKMITEMAEFLEYSVIDRFNDDMHISAYKEHLMDSNHHELWEKVLRVRCDINYGNYVDAEKDYGIIESIIYRVAASCIVDNTYDLFDHYMDILKEHSRDIIEYFKLNGLNPFRLLDYFEEVSIIDVLKKYEGKEIIK